MDSAGRRDIGRNTHVSEFVVCKRQSKNWPREEGEGDTARSIMAVQILSVEEKQSGNEHQGFSGVVRGNNFNRSRRSFDVFRG